MPDAQDSRGYRPNGDDGEDARWMTYAELGLARGINTASAKRLAARRKWRRQPGNDGTARVAVPFDEAMRQNANADDASGELSRLVASLETALATLRDQLQRERERADQATDAAARTELRLAEAEDQIARFRASAETMALLRDLLETALTAEARSRAQITTEAAAERAAREQAETHVLVLRQAQQARRDRGWVARLRAAWRGE